ncbi:lipopolysaccharide biosynthesis protein [Dyella telluris]|uniref:Lipopolysaccharide biosynthesis protein n=1 Tax=Dyella telluris TaxID=2763498 RepID=A0A7G8Q0R8_9GAMM|nr:oligosaccharide flippase family protein [Dyella telluris]QNK00376.1 lipopolysaccharide biosynthesis protein [Dyella telluris]
MKGTLARKSLQTATILVLRLITLAATLVMLTRLLGPAVYGQFASAASCAIVLGTLSTFGSGYVLLKHASGHLDAAVDIWRYAWPLTCIVGSLLFVFYVTVGRGLIGGELTWQLWAIIGATELLLTPLTTLASFALQAAEKVPLSQWIQWFPLGLRVLAVPPCYMLHGPDRLETYVGLQFLASLMGAATGWWIARGYVSLDWRPRLATRDELKEGGTYAAMLLVATNPTEIDKIAAVRQVGATDAGIYVAGSRIMGAVVLPVLAMLLTAQPRLFRHAREQDRNARTLIRTMFALAAGWGILSGILLLLIAPLLPWILGAEFSRTAQLVRWMALATPFTSLRLATGSVLVALGHPLERMGFETLGIILMLIAILTLTPWWGVMGLVAAVILSDLVMAMTGLVLVARCIRPTQPALPQAPPG